MGNASYIKNKYTTSILNAMDRTVSQSTFSFDALEGTLEDKHMDVLLDALYLYKNKDDIRQCKLCRRSELIIDDWFNDMICMNCYTRRNNRNRIVELLKQK